ncbi:MAG: hypothetical protein H6Q72_4890 [Firmicutes bacterium]|nr:hypothetical protein [Bacillota bacterium]
MALRNLSVTPSNLQSIGLNRYMYWENTVGSFSTPATTSIILGIITEGSGIYNGHESKAGDVFAGGFNMEPLSGIGRDVSLFLIDMDFHLFYQLTGLLPSMCREVLFLEPSNPLARLGQRLAALPSDQWIPYAEHFLLKAFTRQFYSLDVRTERLIYVTKTLRQKPLIDFDVLCRQTGVSYRALQRDFAHMLGITPKQYANVHRLYQATEYIRHRQLTDAAFLAGYCDQSHMTREFKRLSGLTPNQISLMHRIDSKMFLAREQNARKHHAIVLPY